MKDIDYDQQMIVVRSGKGNKDRRTILLETPTDQLHEQIITVMRLHEVDLENGYGEVDMPNVLSRKYPNAAKELAWQFLFPSYKYPVTLVLVFNLGIMFRPFVACNVKNAI
ncbi:MAG: hypothetical protein ACI9WC_003632 [Arenicella sp.]